MRQFTILILATLGFAASGCGLEEMAERLAESASPIEIPADKQTYVGVWEAEGMQLVIRADGMVHYERTRGGGSRKLEGPLRAFSGDDFEVGLGGLTTTFEVSAPPNEEGGVWTMTVDGVELQRTADAPGAVPAPDEGTRV